VRVGAVVKLKSGGPPMTVESMIGGSECLCVWFEGTTVQRRPFPTETLIPTKPPGVR
jgi:uncharacterized protein YodC (DUF2158 family)